VFEISTLLGVGGMGEVYRARDTKLGRDVAIKVLPDEFANDRDRLARFGREARLLAALNHPNIAHIHDLQESDGVRFLVMELAEGSTLADRLKVGPLPVAEIYTLFGQIAEGLEAAHQQGIIHRDLKPSNVKITDEGKVSLLDFGLAKAAECPSSSINDGVTSPWHDDSAGRSAVGQVVGTPGYMSPEQARGKAVDKRTDIWAFGCCLFEALTGRRAFQGETASDTLAKVLAIEPNWAEFPAATPPRLRELVQACLVKDPRDRLRDIGDARLELCRIAENPDWGPAPASRSHFARGRLAAAMLAGVVVGLLAGATIWRASRPAGLPDHPAQQSLPVVRSTVTLPPETPIRMTGTSGTMVLAAGPQFALSPDGSTMVYVSGKEGETRLYLRPMAHPEDTRPLRGTERVTSLFFSPDGQSVGFSGGRKLKTIRLDGSQLRDVCDAQYVMGASWGHDGKIYFAETSSGFTPANRGLKWVSELGGSPEWLTHNEGDPKVLGHSWPCVLPDGKLLLFSLQGGAIGDSEAAVLSLTNHKWKRIGQGIRVPQYVPTGHLLFYDAGWFYAARFDPDHGTIGPRLRIVRSSFWPALSDAGCLVHGPPNPYESVDGLPNVRPLVWLDWDGTTQRVNVPPDRYGEVRLSPNGDGLAAEVYNERGIDLVIYDLKGESTPRQVTFGGVNRRPVWSPDGKRLFFAARREGKELNLYSASADGSSPEQRLTQTDLSQMPYSVSPDGHTLAIVQVGSSTGIDICTLPVSGGVAAEPWLQTEFTEGVPAFSPDGRWLAYTSDDNRNGRREVFVDRYPKRGNKTQISDSGGTGPLWSKRGDETFLIYRDGKKLYCVPILETEPALKAGPRRLLFDGPFVEASPARISYDVSPDGQRFLFLEQTDAEEAQGPVDQLFLVQNWFEELKQLAPPEDTAAK
jgi:serine/threonine-protein kinase